MCSKQRVIIVRRILSLILLVPVAIVLIAFVVANRHVVQVSLDPLNPVDPAFSLNMPMYMVIFAAIVIGLVLGGIGTWLTQGKHRRLARNRRQEAAKWKFEAEKKEQENPTETFTRPSGKGPAFPVLPKAEMQG